MNGRKLQDRLYLSLGISARHVGHFADAFRPSGPLHPLNKENQFLKLPATFISTQGAASHANVYGDALWHGIFDASYTRPGDYLVTASGTFFVASQDPLLPVLCVITNRTISLARPNIQTNAAGNTYGGYTSGSSTILMDRWPASVLTGTKSSLSGVDLPTDQVNPYWNVLLPMATEVILSPGDILTDDLHRTAVISGSELTNLGWRISAKMANT